MKLEPISRIFTTEVFRNGLIRVLVSINNNLDDINETLKTFSVVNDPEIKEQISFSIEHLTQVWRNYNG